MRRAYYEIPSELLQHQRATNQFLPRGTRRFNRRTMICMYHYRAEYSNRSACKFAFARVRRRRRCFCPDVSQDIARAIASATVRQMRATCTIIASHRTVVIVSLSSTLLTQPMLLALADHYTPFPKYASAIDRSRDPKSRCLIRSTRATIVASSESALCRVIAIVL